LWWLQVSQGVTENCQNQLRYFVHVWVVVAILPWVSCNGVEVTEQNDPEDKEDEEVGHALESSLAHSDKQTKLFEHSGVEDHVHGADDDNDTVGNDPHENVFISLLVHILFIPWIFLPVFQGFQEFPFFVFQFGGEDV
jgi:hypothetical protein